MDLPTLNCPRAPRPPASADLVPVDGNPAVVQSTRLTIYCTESHLLLAFHCLDSDIWGTYFERDDPLYEEEVVEAFLCPTGDLRHYYEFEVSPRNVVFDAKVYCPDVNRTTMVVDTTWDCPGLETTVTVDGIVHHTRPGTRHPTPDTRSSWSVEMWIPFASLGVNPPRPGDVWRANFYRIDRADPPEFTAWSPTLENPPNFHVPERFGYLEFE